MMRSLILASASPRRAELLRQIGLSFDVVPADIDEQPLPSEAPSEYVLRLAREKALAIGEGAPGAIVIGSDTSVVLDNRILGKPTDENDAIQMLEQLSNRAHQVMTAVAVAVEGQCEALTVTVEVGFRRLSRPEIEAYVRTGEPMDKAGGYGIQGLGGIFVESLQGSYSAVVGLPLKETADLLAAAGYPVWTTWQQGQESLNE